MAETVEQHTKILDNGDSTSTDYDWITGGSANQDTLITAALIVNNDAVSQTVTVKLHDTGSNEVFSRDYVIAAADHAHIDVVLGQSLGGHATTAEKVTVAFGTALGASDTIGCRASAVLFS